MKTYHVIAEMIDSKTGERKFPGDTFTPHDDDQEKRLRNAECISADKPADGTPAPASTAIAAAAPEAVTDAPDKPQRGKPKA
jgi:hypothetical protein